MKQILINYSKQDKQDSVIGENNEIITPEIQASESCIVYITNDSGVVKTKIVDLKKNSQEKVIIEKFLKDIENVI